MPGTRRVDYQFDQIFMESGQTTWNPGALIARSTTAPQAGRLATSGADHILGVYGGSAAANASSPFGVDQAPKVVRCGTGVPVLVQTSATIAQLAYLAASSVTPGTVRAAVAGDKIIGQAMTAVSVGGTGKLVLADIWSTDESVAIGGTAATGVTAAEVQDGSYHRTTLTVATVMPAIAGGANLAVGKLLYTMPAGVIAIWASHMALALDEADGNITADTPDGGLGTVIASGVVALLNGTATFENILTGQTFNDCNGTVETVALAPTAGAPFIMNAADAHTVHFNLADGWAANGEAALAVSGTVTLLWSQLA
jgi:hypothetical protein